MSNQNSTDIPMSGFVLGNNGVRADFKPASILAAGASLVGRFEFDAPLLVDCAVEGDLIGSAAIRIGPNGRVEGKIVGTHVIIDGKVKGRVEASQGLSLGASAELLGEFSTRSLAVEEGARIEGNCSMTFDNKSPDSFGYKAARAAA